MNLTGKWKGLYVYGPGYPVSYIGRSEEFILDIVDDDGIITGICDDPIVQKKAGNASTIKGAFLDGFLSFIKEYRYSEYIIEPNSGILEEDLSSSGIHYTGTLYKPFFSRKDAFKGEWVMSTIYTYPGGKKHETVSKGSWKMKRI
jgi:hypothetical protein